MQYSLFTHEAIQTSSSGPVTVRVEDQFGNLETGDNSTSVSIALSDGSFTPGSATDATASGGIASFGSLIPEPPRIQQYTSAGEVS